MSLPNTKSDHQPDTSKQNRHGLTPSRDGHFLAGEGTTRDSGSPNSEQQNKLTAREQALRANYRQELLLF